MIIHDQIKVEKLQYDTIREAEKYLIYHQAKLISMNILQVKNYYLLIKNK